MGKTSYYITLQIAIILEEKIKAFDSSGPSVDLKLSSCENLASTRVMGCVSMEVFRTSFFANTIPSG
jgi:hypothetical protein